MIRAPITGEEVPAGRVERSLDEEFMADSSLPSWLSTASSGTGLTKTHHPLTTERGELELASNNADSYLVGPEFDPSLYEEIRLRVTGRTTLTGGNYLIMSMADNSGTGSTDNKVQIYQRPDDSATTVTVEDGGTETTATTNVDFLTGDSFDIELRVRPDDKAVDILEGDDVVFSDSGMGIGVANWWPRLRLDTRPEATNESLFVGTFSVSFLHQ